MRSTLRTLALLFGAFCAVCDAADDPGAAPPPPPPGPALDRIVVGVDGATLTGTNGGEGGAVAYLHQEGALLVGLGAEYQRLATSKWGFGSFNIAYSHPMTASSSWNVHAEAHEGTGNVAGAPFLYSIVAAGVGAALPGGIGADVEERQIDVDTSHGSLPKVSLSKGWGKHFLTSFGYGVSVGGNLNTSYTLARVDFYGPGFSLLGGGDVGRVSPAVVNINGVLTSQARHLNEVFAGITKPLKQVDVTLLADRIDLAGIDRLTFTLNFSVRLQ